ncbi:uncharacterized protein L203_105544 [Cryptococcus depauperatus CBS 7841]|uniref:Uncharacterized protein n=1 Tax=Cryptococcus depauperatus CBS 7841 TaxID=1295531 RepID=A0A1E3IFJ4_9TREE|nr:hypothetical protein L203_04223 [Cryptococcus depauperatus CBS 7841]
MGGDHKCPLCSATFTRPQHVGRHLRAHTGDRPYECKECPLRFARSDLLSRHVNKTHRTQEGAASDKKTVKKGRRKSMSTAAQSSLAKDAATETQGQKNLEQSQQHHVEQQAQQIQQASKSVRERSKSENFSQQPQLQAQKMYPHHPLFAPRAPQSQVQTLNSWNLNPSGSFVATAEMALPPMYGTNLPRPAINSTTNLVGVNSTFPTQTMLDTPLVAQPMRLSGSDQLGYKSGSQLSAHIPYDWGAKKRACDQCNLAKVKCESAEPCLRCRQRNLSCSYHKGQRPATSMGPPLASSQTTSLLNMANEASSNSSSQKQAQSQFAENYINPTEPIECHKLSVASLPSNVGMVPSPSDTNSSTWGTYPQSATGATWPPPQIQSSFSMPLGTAPGSITGQTLESSPAMMNVSLPMYQTQVQTQSGMSPTQMSIINTSSLVSNTESPLEMDGSVGKQGRRNDIASNVLDLNAGSGMFRQHTSPPQLPSNKVSPLGQALRLNNSSQNSMNRQNVVDGRWRVRDSFSSDEGSSMFSSSATSALMEQLADNAAAEQNNHARRKSSQSAWAKAMEQMSIQDSQKTVTPTVPTSMREGSESMPSNASSGPGESLAVIGETHVPDGPSLSEAKELWKLFMADSISGLTPAGEKLNDLDIQNIPLVTPRPGIGKRTLSRSNSMPDLNSPLANGPAFFTTFLNGTTPKPTNLQESYIPVQQAAESKDANNTGDEPDKLKWSEEIEARQSSFSLGKPRTRHGKNEFESKDKLSKGEDGVDISRPAHPVRPHPSVFQPISALNQTLAPERMPSFSLTPALELAQNPHFSKTGLTPADAKAGNKRMASSTLVNEHGKKAIFSVWGEEGPVSGDCSGLQDQDISMYVINGGALGPL